MSGDAAPDGLIQYEARPAIEAGSKPEIESQEEEGEDK